MNHEQEHQQPEKRRDIQAELKKYNEQNPKCSFCDNMGVVYALNSEGNRYAFACDCGASNIVGFAYPSWRGDLVAKGFKLLRVRDWTNDHNNGDKDK